MNSAIQMIKTIINNHHITTRKGKKNAFNECIEYIDCMMRNPFAVGDAKETLSVGLNIPMPVIDEKLKDAVSLEYSKGYNDGSKHLRRAGRI